MRWQGQQLDVVDDDALAGLESPATVTAMAGLVRTVTTPEFAGVTFHEVHAKSALNHVPGASAMPFAWTVNPYRGCTHACVYCFARRTHEYLDFDSGRDFDEQIVVKTNVADVLRRELARPGWQHEHVALGTNTDPYQRAEGRYRLMPGIIDALATSGTPFSVLTKGTLLRRDLPLLTQAAEAVQVGLSMSIAVVDDTLREALEPGAPTWRARLATIRAASEAGFRPTVFLMPILPHLTDDPATIDHALAELKEAGTRRVVFGALHLRPGAKQWFWQWLEHEHPELLARYRGLYPGASVNTPVGYRKLLSARVRPLLRRHGLAGGLEDEAPSQRAGPDRSSRQPAGEPPQRRRSSDGRRRREACRLAAAQLFASRTASSASAASCRAVRVSSVPFTVIHTVSTNTYATVVVPSSLSTSRVNATSPPSARSRYPDAVRSASISSSRAWAVISAVTALNPPSDAGTPHAHISACEAARTVPAASGPGMWSAGDPVTAIVSAASANRARTTGSGISSPHDGITAASGASGVGVADGDGSGVGDGAGDSDGSTSTGTSGKPGLAARSVVSTCSARSRPWGQPGPWTVRSTESSTTTVNP